MNTISYKNIIAVAVLLAVVGFLTIAMQQPRASASIRSGDEYMATSTASNTMYGASITGNALIRTGYGSLGSVIITGAGTGIWNIYNATTSDVTKRTGNVATTSILLASFPASATAGTYTFDVTYTTGLLVELESGVMATSTITFR
jgi:hypothetical protein